jgi:hypothetical protein
LDAKINKRLNKAAIRNFLIVLYIRNGPTTNETELNNALGAETLTLSQTIRRL